MRTCTQISRPCSALFVEGLIDYQHGFLGALAGADSTREELARNWLSGRGRITPGDAPSRATPDSRDA